jgi:hypothetical protein
MIKRAIEALICITKRSTTVARFASKRAVAVGGRAHHATRFAHHDALGFAGASVAG